MQKVWSCLDDEGEEAAEVSFVQSAEVLGAEGAECQESVERGITGKSTEKSGRGGV